MPSTVGMMDFPQRGTNDPSCCCRPGRRAQQLRVDARQPLFDAGPQRRGVAELRLEEPQIVLDQPDSRREAFPGVVVGPGAALAARTHGVAVAAHQEIPDAFGPVRRRFAPDVRRARGEPLGSDILPELVPADLECQVDLMAGGGKHLDGALVVPNESGVEHDEQDLAHDTLSA
jgi:hypothetical protein